MGDNKSTMVLDMQAVYQVLTPVLKSETSESEEAKVVEENENVAEAESHANDAELFAPVAEVKKEAVEPSETTAE